MHDFGKIVYLEMQKSGSTFVNKFLKECCLLKGIKHQKHGAIRDDYDREKFYFITIRHPYDLYSSLYRYGLDGRGGIYKQLEKLGKTACYKSFNSFIEFVVDPKNARYFGGGGYSEQIANQVGIMSFRFMKLSLQFPLKQMATTLARGESLLDLEDKFITNLEIRNENLNGELVRLSTELFPDLFDQEKVVRFFDGNERVNASKTPNDGRFRDEMERVLAQIEKKETLLLSRYSTFYTSDINP
jgi:hypothetical protein